MVQVRDVADATVLAPLLHEEGRSGRNALVAQRARPIRMHRARILAALAADDDPVEFVGYVAEFRTSVAECVEMTANPRAAREIAEIYRPQQRLRTHAPDRKRRLQQDRNELVCVFLGGTRDETPDVGERPWPRLAVSVQFGSDPIA